MNVTLEQGDFGTYLLVADDGRDVLIQTDWDYPGVAENLGWSPSKVGQGHCHVAAHAGEECPVCDGCPFDADCPDCCEHDATDGTVTCTCGVTATAFIASAQEWLDEHTGETFEDPGYFGDETDGSESTMHLSERANKLRRCIFRPYLAGKGPVFTLDTWDTGRVDDRGQTLVGYKLRMRAPGGPLVTLFVGKDYSPSPSYAIDSDKATRGLMGFLCLKPGDTDARYFAGYTDAQRAFAEEHGEALEFEVVARLGDD